MNSSKKVAHAVGGKTAGRVTAALKRELVGTALPTTLSYAKPATPLCTPPTSWPIGTKRFS
ncbi:hypothetical protein C1H46_021972 [Malus baccata]|uniref:Uncharacterized protein n=1 Tax=Malus baccata TaxID=106549 RepID=A0A540M0Z8_MALBA|nr:hypothetical protein C1H46_021972 [Malus baccata]